MTRVSRKLVLPLLAIVVPCLVIGAMTYQWLAVEREARTHRGAEAGLRAIAALRSDLSAALRTTADEAARDLRKPAAGAGPFAPPPVPPRLLQHAYFFNAQGQLQNPNVGDVVARQTASHLEALRTAKWQQALAEIQALEAGDQNAQALQRIDALLPDARPASIEATLRLARARILDVLGRSDDADGAARKIVECCAEARDEYGTSFAIYAAWKRAGLSGGRPDAVRTDKLIRELSELYGRGVLGSAEDATDIALLAGRLNDTLLTADLVTLARHARDVAGQRATDEQAISHWLNETGVPVDMTRPVVAPIRGRPNEVAVAWLVDGGQVLAGRIDTARLNEWVAAWPGSGGSLSLSMDPAASGGQDGHLTSAPLFLEAPGLTVFVRPTGVDSESDQVRERLFVGAVLFSLALTIGIGLFALRDRARESRTAALQSTFVAGITHELKTPLASIRLLAETLRMNRAKPESRDELLETIVEETDRLERFVDNVLSSSRIDSGTRAYAPQLIAVGDVVRSTAGRFEKMIAKHGFRVVQHIEALDLRVRADPEALGQALMNLLGNAVKYSGESRDIEIGVSQNESEAEVRVSDHGLGVPLAERDRIFDSFYRAAEARAETTGAGLGLSLVRHFAEAHGGRVTLTSQPGQGSTFSVWLPIAEPCHEDAPTRG
jgi:signal transduction histidine kinase